jgi:hypothetical protein
MTTKHLASLKLSDSWYIFQVWVGQGGGDPVPMLYSRLVSDEADVIPALEQLSAFSWIGGKPLAHLMPKGQYKYQPELPWRTYSPQFHNYYAFCQLPCDEFSQTELDEYAVNAWP